MILEVHGKHDHIERKDVDGIPFMHIRKIGTVLAIFRLTPQLLFVITGK